MKALQLHDKFTEEVIGTVLIREKDDQDAIMSAWDEYQVHHSSNAEKEGDIWDFVNSYPKLDMEVLEIDFYQP